jgi:ribosomal protein S18 acetylase RimI-like enzyme
LRKESDLVSDTAAILDVRLARPEDREAVFTFCARTWPDGDYIPSVWDEWLTDDDGTLLVAVAGTQPVGLIHLRMMSPDESWIEGVRVDPTARRQGVGRVLVSRALVTARERGAQVARLFTDYDNLPAQSLFAHFGFTRIAEVVRYTAPALEDAPEALAGGMDAHASTAADTPRNPPTPTAAAESAPAEEDNTVLEGAHITTPGEDQFERVWDRLVQSNLAPLTGGLEFDGWSARALSEPFLRAEMTSGRVLMLEDWDTILALAVIQDFPGTVGERSSLDIRYIDGFSDAIGRLALVLREVAQDHGLARVTLWLPDLLILHDAMDGAGYTRDSGAMWIYARDL